MKLDYILASSACGSIIIFAGASALRSKINRRSLFIILMDLVLILTFMSGLVTTLWLRDKNPILLVASVFVAILVVAAGYLVIGPQNKIALRKPRQTETAP